MAVKLAGGPASVRFKIILLFLALCIGGATLIYTNQLVVRLQKKEQQSVELFAKGIESLNTTNEGADITFLFENIIRPIDFPMIVTDANDSVNFFDKSTIRNFPYDTTAQESLLREYFRTEIIKMDEIHKPIPVIYVMGKDTILLNRIHYGDSDLINELRSYPYKQMAVAAVFLLIGYIGFSQIKRSEQSNIWVGMAKETAHQFGTPLSSLMGWVELLKNNFRNTDKVLDIADEIQSDVDRLNKITNRFSKIGSKAELKEGTVSEDINKVIEYFARRIPQTGKKVELKLSGDLDAKAMLNSGLFEWVLENLIKNALDAIEHSQGLISFSVKELPAKVEIEITDNGKGVDVKHRKDIFRPGYSTKRRGWGLGLSLSKRIIEDYHHGKIWVKSSAPNQGTTFKIVLNKN